VDGVNFCYETTYTDATYAKKGWKSGKCPATFNTIVSTSHETICKGHSEENIKYCPKSKVTILVTKKGVKGRINSMSSAAKPDGKTYCCSVGSATACNGPDWMPISISFSKAGASSANVSITIDGTAGACAMETSSVSGSAVAFPNINNATDCLALLITNTGALPGDLVVTYDAGADTVGFEVDSEGVTETLQACT
jgi:hypothetical protein